MKTYSNCREHSRSRSLGWQLVLMLVACCLITVRAQAENVMLKDSAFVALPGHKLEVRLDFDMPPPSPRAYAIDSPPRLVLDLFGASNDLGRRQLDIKTGQVDSLSLAETEGRLRIVANLNQMVGYETYTEGNSLFMVFGGSAAARRRRRCSSAPPGSRRWHRIPRRPFAVPGCRASISSVWTAVTAGC
ncbi:AMIN domain-containing protein [Marinobacterium aestuariivivens]|uniref:AMIN domain-containing protein n=1 Tax=Marinobacterium aestuariivivens TaxID=1698799 RepID=A0ABW1ZYE1_9GAMM